MPVPAEYVSEIFKGLEEGDGASFFSHVDDKVDWIVEGTHPLAGHYHSKAPPTLRGARRDRSIIAAKLPHRCASASPDEILGMHRWSGGHSGRSRVGCPAVAPVRPAKRMSSVWCCSCRVLYADGQVNSRTSLYG
jgi:hypothetical protein